jgi:cyanophycinase
MSGPLVLVGGDEWNDGCSFDAGLLEESGSDEVVVIVAGSAFEEPAADALRAQRWFDVLGAATVVPDLLMRRDALDADVAAQIRSARFIYLGGGSPMHLRSVLKDTPAFDAIVSAWKDGAVLAGAGAGADVLCDPMVDPRGGAYTVGLGVVPGLAVIPRYDTWSEEKVHRTVSIIPTGAVVAGVPLRTALIKRDSVWTSEGVGQIDVWDRGKRTTFADLPV